MYWSQYSTVLAFGAILDPRIKLSMLNYFYSKVETDPLNFQEKMSLVKRSFTRFYGQYSSVTETISQPQSPSTTLPQMRK
ncbi:zinc finger BED domain-containing protein RICESLEEPER 2-like [Dorcoceras hygrometricum]|uniref:Zinc finger BED domain-containing protein RICESLEEPER 2-like n=1 Tax=Dorcoceras hygrometricum TaxID=472368 RepID=A0A2Z7AIU6_9LAMI|nr:zinc finger BED domain-containing protein RICESLEEPER 2-like [Dorcoceras hygrometricum]